MNTELAGWFSSVQFSSQLPKTISICLYELSEQSHLSNVAAETHMHRSLSHLTQPALANMGSSSDLRSPWLSLVCSQERAVSHHRNFSCDAIRLTSSHAMAHPFLETTREQTGDNGKSGDIGASSFQPSSSSTTGYAPAFAQSEAPRVRGISIYTHQRSPTWLRARSWQAPGKLASCPG